MYSPQETENVINFRIERGKNAERLLADPLLVHALRQMESEIIDTMKRLKPTDSEGRDACWRELRALERFRGKFTSYVRTGREAHKTFLQRAKQKITG